MILYHFHAKYWQSWLSHYRYRSDLKPSHHKPGQKSIYALLSALEHSEGDARLRRLFNEAYADSPALRQQLSDYGGLHDINLRIYAAISSLPNTSLNLLQAM